MYGTYISVDQPAQRSSRKLPLVLFAAFAVVVCVALVTFHLDGQPAELEQQRPRPLNFFTRDELQQLNHKLLPTVRVKASARKSRLSWRIQNHPNPMERKDMPLLAIDLPAKPDTVPYSKPQIGDFDGDTAPSVGDPLGVKLPTQLTEVPSRCLCIAAVALIFVRCGLLNKYFKPALLQVGHEKRGSFYIRLDQLKPTDDERDDEGLSEDSTTYIHIYGRYVFACAPFSWRCVSSLCGNSHCSCFACHTCQYPLFLTFYNHLHPCLMRVFPQSESPSRLHPAWIQTSGRPIRRPARHRHGFQDGVRWSLTVAEWASSRRQPR
jgi:hypothetical protein